MARSISSWVEESSPIPGQLFDSQGGSDASDAQLYGKGNEPVVAYRRPGDTPGPAFRNVNRAADEPRAAVYRCRRTMIVKLVVARLALVSVAEQRTRVRPIRNRLPERGRHVTGTGSSTSSVAVTLNFTRTLFA
jgi:hypothetical protein